MADELAAKPALAHDEDTIGYFEELRHFGADHQDSRTAASEFIHHLENFGLGAHVDAAGGFIE